MRAGFVYICQEDAAHLFEFLRSNQSIRQDTVRSHFDPTQIHLERLRWNFPPIYTSGTCADQLRPRLNRSLINPKEIRSLPPFLTLSTTGLCRNGLTRFPRFSWTSFLDFLNGLRRANSRLYFLRFNLIEIIEVIGYSGEKFNALQSRFYYLRLVDRGWGFY